MNYTHLPFSQHSDSREVNITSEAHYKMDAVIRPYGTLDFLTQREISELSGPDEGPLKKLFHRCALAVLNTGEETDSSLEVMECYREFEIRVIQKTRGINLELKNAP